MARRCHQTLLGSNHVTYEAKALYRVVPSTGCWWRLVTNFINIYTSPTKKTAMRCNYNWWNNIVMACHLSHLVTDLSRSLFLGILEIFRISETMLFFFSTIPSVHFWQQHVWPSKPSVDCHFLRLATAAHGALGSCCVAMCKWRMAEASWLRLGDGDPREIWKAFLAGMCIMFIRSC